MSQLLSSVMQAALSVKSRIFDGYGELLKEKHSARFAFGAIIASMPYPMIGMAVTISVQQVYGSYTLAGSLSAVQAIASAIVGPFLGRLVDRYGQKKISIPVVAVWLVAATAMLSGILMRVEPFVLFIIAPFLTAIPPWGAMARARWTYLLKDKPNSGERINRAMSFSSILDEFMWLVGNPLSSILAVYSGILAFSFTAVCVFIGTGMFLSVAYAEPPSRVQLAREAGLTLHELNQRDKEKAAQENTSDVSNKGLFSLGFLSICVTWFGIGAYQSASAISIIAFAKEQNMQYFTGFVFACCSASALVGAIIYGAKNWTIPLWKRFYFCIVVVAFGFSSFLFATNLWMVMVIYLIVGLCQSPTWINGSQIVLRLVPQARFTEGMAIMGALSSIGGSIGNALAGVAIDNYGSQGGFVVAMSLAMVAMVLAFAGMKQIRDATTKPMLTTIEI